MDIAQSILKNKTNLKFLWHHLTIWCRQM